MNERRVDKKMNGEEVIFQYASGRSTYEVGGSLHFTGSILVVHSFRKCLVPKVGVGISRLN